MTVPFNTPVSTAMAALPPDVRTRADAELEPGERVVWVAQPVARLVRRGTWPIVVFAIPWTAFAVFWVVSASTAASHFGPSGPGGIANLFPLFGVPFILIGLGMLTAPLWIGRAAARSVYLITDRRAVVMRAGVFGTLTVRSYRAAGLGAITRRERADGSGDLIFERYVTRDSDGDRRTTTYGFEAIESVRDVENLLRRTLLSQAAAAS